MTSTPFVSSSFAGQTAGTLLSAYAPQSGDVNAVFSKLSKSNNGSAAQTTLQFGANNNLRTTAGNADAYYAAGGAVLASGQTQIDLQQDILVDSLGMYIQTMGFNFGDDGTSANFCECVTWQGTAASSPGFHLSNRVASASNDLATPAYALTVGSTYTMLLQIRGTPGAYNATLQVGLKGAALTTLFSAVAVPNLVMPGRYAGLRDGYTLTSGSSTAQTDSVGIQRLNFIASNYNVSTALAAGTVSVVATGSGTATATTTAAFGGTAPYSYQFQRAPVTGGTVGSYANVGTAGTSLTFNDTETVGTTFSYQVVVTDSASTPATATSAAVGYTYPTPSFSLTTAPTSLSLGQGTSLTAVVTSAATGGYSLAESLSVSGLPAGVTGSFNPVAITGSGTSTLTLTGAGNATTGTSTVTVTGTDTNGLAKTVTMALTVTAPTSGVTLDTVNNNVLALICALNASVNRNTFS